MTDQAVPSPSGAFAPNEDHEALRASVRAFLQAYSTSDDVRSLMASDDGYDRAVWSAMATQLELTGIAIPAEYGGGGFSFVELSIVLEEMGRRLLCAPYLSTVVLAANALLASSDDDAMRRYLPSIAAGTLLATVAIDERDAVAETAGSGVEADEASGGVALTGSRQFVFDGCIADLILVPSRTATGVGLFAVEAAASGLTRERLATLDQTRKQARLTFAATPATRVGLDNDAIGVFRRVLDLAAVALAAEQVGGAAQALDDAVAYAKTRVQFGVPIGSFQAIKHKCADVLVTVESATSIARYAAWAAAHDAGEFPIVAPMAKSCCSEAYLRAASNNIQVHGGLGFTWDHSAHLYFKRAKSSELLLGSPRHHRRVLADRIGV